METLFRKVFTKDRLPENVVNWKVFDTDKGRLLFIPPNVWSKDDVTTHPEWWLEPIAPANREGAIKIAEKYLGGIGVHDEQINGDEVKGLIDALINEGLLLGKSVNEEMLEAFLKSEFKKEACNCPECEAKFIPKLANLIKKYLSA